MIDSVNGTLSMNPRSVDQVNATNICGCFRAMLVVLALLSVHAVMSESEAADQVTRTADGATIRGEFTEMTKESVTIQTSGGKKETVSVADIRNLQFDQEPPILGQARANERSGVFDAALEKYEQVRSDSDLKERRLRTEVDFLIARTRVRRALADSGSRDTALTAIKEFREKHPGNFRYLEATMLHAAIVAETGDRAAAEALLQEVRSSSVPGFQLQAGVQLGRIQLAQGDALTAMAAFEDVIAATQNDAADRSVHFEAMLGKSLCLQKQSKQPEAVQVLDEIIERAASEDSRLLAEAWLRKGSCLQETNQLKAALMAYLHVDVLYSSEPAEHAEALFHLSKLWEETKRPDRAADADARLKEKYPNSSWAVQDR